MHGTLSGMQLSHTRHNFVRISWRCSKMLIDAYLTGGYPFHNAGVTESLGVELGPLPLLAMGLGGRNRIEAREVV